MISIPKMIQIMALLDIAGLAYAAFRSDMMLSLLFGVLLVFNTILFQKTKQAMREMRI